MLWRKIRLQIQLKFVRANLSSLPAGWGFGCLTPSSGTPEKTETSSSTVVLQDRLILYETRPWLLPPSHRLLLCLAADQAVAGVGQGRVSRVC